MSRKCSLSKFPVKTIATRRRALRFQQTLKMAVGAWTDQNHPHLKTQADVNHYLARFRNRFNRGKRAKAQRPHES